MAARRTRRQDGRRVPIPRRRRPPLPAWRRRRAIIGVMASRVTSTRFVGRAAELGGAAGRAGRGGRRTPVARVRRRRVRASARRGCSRELERAARADGVRVIGGDCVELGEGELPYAPLVGALRPLARSGDPALRGALAAGPRAPRADPARASGAAPRATADEATAPGARCSTACSSCWSCSRGEDGLLLTIEDLHWADRSTRAFLVYLAPARCAASACSSSPRYRPDELHRRHPLRPLLAELERDARAPPRRAARRSPAPSWPSSSTDILGAAPTGELLTACSRAREGNPLFAEELLAAGHRRPRRAPADAARRADAADRAAVRRRAGAAAAARRRPPARPRRARRRLADRPARAARRAARGRRGAARRRRRRGPLRVPPRAAARGRGRRPAAGRAGRPAPGARARARERAARAARARRRAPGGRRSPTTTSRPATSRPRWRASVRAGEARPRPSTPTARRRRCSSARCELWDRVADAERAGRARPRRACCARRHAPPAASTSPPARSPAARGAGRARRGRRPGARRDLLERLPASSSTRAAPSEAAETRRERSSCCPRAERGRARSLGRRSPRS